MIYQIEMIRSATAMSKDDPNASVIYRIRLTGNFVMEITEEFSLFLNTLINGGMKKVAFDLTDLKYIDSTGIGIFITVTKAIRSRGGDLVFLNVNQKILEVFHLVKLNDFIQLFRGEKQVIDHFFSLKV